MTATRPVHTATPPDWDRARAAGPVAQADVLADMLRAAADVEASTALRLGTIIGRFARRQVALGATLEAATPEQALGFVHARTRRGRVPSVATMHLRRTALRVMVALIAELTDTPVDDPTVALVLPAKTRAAVRPLDDAEMTVLRLTAAGRARSRLLAMATVALAEATATTGEIATMVWYDLDPTIGEVCLPGAGRTGARVATLTGWGRAAIDQHALASHPELDELVAYRGDATAEQPRQAAIVNRLTHLLATAGLADHDIRPSSIRLWQPARDLHAGTISIEQAARQLGVASLDTAAELLGHHWHHSNDATGTVVEVAR